MPYFAYNVGGWVQKEGKMCLRNKSMAPYHETDTVSEDEYWPIASVWSKKCNFR